LTSEDKVLKEIEDKIKLLFSKIEELKVTERERNEFEMQKTQYKVKIDDYKRHYEALLKREEQWNLQHL